jgi:exonuclease SbcC
MIPLKLILRGFLTYRDKATLDFENMRTAVIVGDNGHGKSALFDAITYALFGKHRGGNTRALVNQESRELAVRFEFEAGGRRYRIDRSLTLSARANGVPDAAATGFIFDGADWQAVAHGCDKCDEWVREVLGGMTYEICCQSVLLRQGAHDKFLAAKPTERQTVLNTLLDFEPYRRLQAAARGRKSAAKNDADGLAGRLGDLVAHDPDTLTRLEVELGEAQTGNEQAGLTVASAKDRLNASSRFLELTESLARIDDGLAAQRELIEQTGEVRTAARRRRDLEGAIPLLRAALEAERLAVTADTKVRTATGKLADLDLVGRREAADAASRALEAANTDSGAARDKASALAREREALKPRGEALAEADRERAAADRESAEAAELKPLSDTEPTERAEAERLAGLKAAIPWLRQVSTARATLRQLGGLIVESNAEIAAERSKQEADEDAVRLAQDVSDAAARGRQIAADALTRTQLDVANLEQQLEHRHEASAEQVCTHCGQAIDPKRVAEEIRSLVDRKTTAEAAVVKAAGAVRDADAACRASASALEAAKNQRSAREARIKELDGELRRATTDVANAEGRTCGGLRQRQSGRAHGQPGEVG